MYLCSPKQQINLQVDIAIPTFPLNIFNKNSIVSDLLQRILIYSKEVVELPLGLFHNKMCNNTKSQSVMKLSSRVNAGLGDFST